MSLILMAFLMITLWGLTGLGFRYIFSRLYGDVIPAFLGTPFNPNAGFLDMLTMDPYDSPVMKLLLVWKIIDYVLMVVGLLGACVLLLKMRKQCETIVSDITAFDETVRVKKSSFLWLGFLLGGYGAHLLYIKKRKKGLIFLGLGLAGMFNPVTFLYTSAISFADAFLICFYPKDCDGMVEFEYYPYWL